MRNKKLIPFEIIEKAVEMCIRDSVQSGCAELVHKRFRSCVQIDIRRGGSSLLCKPLSEISSHGFFPVSYTHLDVYKRQFTSCAVNAMLHSPLL